MMLTDTQLNHLYILLENEDAELGHLLDELNSRFKTVSERTALLSSLVIILSEPRLLTSRCSSVIGLYFLYKLASFNPHLRIPPFSKIYSLYLRFAPSPERSLILWLLSSMCYKLDHCTARDWIELGACWEPDRSQLETSELSVIDEIASLPFKSQDYLMVDKNSLDGLFENIRQLSGSQLAASFFSELRHMLQKKFYFAEQPQTRGLKKKGLAPSQDLPKISIRLKKASDGTLTKNVSDLLISDLLNLDAEQLKSISIKSPDIQNLIKFNKDIAVAALRVKLKLDPMSRLVEELEELKISVNTFEVLESLHEFVSDNFFLRYISKLIKKISECPKNSSHSDVQILCMYIKHLIEKQFPISDELLYEIKSLCIQFSFLKGAAELFAHISKVSAEKRE